VRHQYGASAEDRTWRIVTFQHLAREYLRISGSHTFVSSLCRQNPENCTPRGRRILWEDSVVTHR